MAHTIHLNDVTLLTLQEVRRVIRDAELNIPGFAIFPKELEGKCKFVAPNLPPPPVLEYIEVNWLQITGSLSSDWSAANRVLQWAFENQKKTPEGILNGCGFSFPYHGYSKPEKATPTIQFSIERNSTSVILRGLDSDQFAPNELLQFFEVCRKRLNLNLVVAIVDERLVLRPAHGRVLQTGAQGDYHVSIDGPIGTAELFSQIKHLLVEDLNVSRFAFDWYSLVVDVIEPEREISMWESVREAALPAKRVRVQFDYIVKTIDGVEQLRQYFQRNVKVKAFLGSFPMGHVTAFLATSARSTGYQLSIETPWYDPEFIERINRVLQTNFREARID